MNECELTAIRDAAARCIECGICETVQDEGCGCTPGMWGPFAHHIAEGASRGSIDPATERLLFTCSLCDGCTQACPVDISAAAVVREGRRVFHGQHPSARERWRPMMVDLAGNSFARLRAWRGISYDDAALDPRQPCESLFFPGCTLSTYGPELTMATFDYLASKHLADGMTALCCGNPLWGLGLKERGDAYASALSERLAMLDTQRIIAGCPNCYRALRQRQVNGLIAANIEISALPQVLVDAGARITAERSVAPDAETFCVYDSCSDRATRAFGSAVRELLPPGSWREMQHAGEDALCCGSGGMVSFYDVSVCQTRRTRCVGEFQETNADCLVTACVSCTNSMLRSGTPVSAHHYLELLFDTPIRWEAHRAASIELAQSDERNGMPAGLNDPILP
ncbi:(Fe-S)-binding protein [Denitrobacterium detoxificans]|uniref:(Fe-S)-binding protein n=1 Tax=Denitrobacterium detoxificans TaxID=79604 RepID=UPI0026EFA13C|nr:(Fe-S)-binding protein [Denitrobacterium detoxificans]